MGLLRSLNDAFTHMELTEKDEPAMELARIYAEEIEYRKAGDSSVKDLGQGLMRLLAELLMTPKARAAIQLNVKEVAANDADAEGAAIFQQLRERSAPRN